MPNATIVRQYQTTEINSQGRSERVIVVDFNVGTDGPFSVSISLPEYTADRVRAEIDKIAYEVLNVQNLT